MTFVCFLNKELFSGFLFDFYCNLSNNFQVATDTNIAILVLSRHLTHKSCLIRSSVTD